jgi:leucyl-tRNA synthetase
MAIENGEQPGGVDRYEPASAELKWQRAWEEAGLAQARPQSEARADTYIFVTPPFTSGGAHMGHVRSYTIADAFARFRRAQGDSVLFTLGFDAFGLPSEQGAIQEGISPAEWVERCRATMQRQFSRLGVSFDWSRSFASSEPDLYRWSQWLFLHLLERDLVYRREGQVEWCPTCATVLANLQVEDGRCWRCGEQVELVRRAQWYLRRSAYNEENHQRLPELDRWNKTALAAQRATLGPVEGVELDAKSLDGRSLTVFTTMADALGSAKFVLISPNHPDLEQWVEDPAILRELESQRQGGGRREERREAQTLALDTGVVVQVPGIEDPLPIFISPSVDGRVGPTAMLGIPDRDRTDAAIGAQLEAKEMAIRWRGSTKREDPRPAVRYRAADFTISRQRAWGAPIPLVHCEDCGTVPVPVGELPVRLPENLAAEPGAGLDRFPDFVACECPRCGKPARRETDTLDCHMDAAWTVFPPTVPPEDRPRQLFGHPEMKRWLPVTQMVQGADTGGFILNMRLVSKALRDAGVIDFLPTGEPFGASLMHEMVQLDGRKMSKHLGNVVDPQELIERYGADAVRFAILYAAAPDRSFSWNEHALRHCASFLDGLWSMAAPRLAARAPLADSTSLDAIDDSDRLRSRLVFWCDSGIKRITAHLQKLEMHQATRNVMRFAERIGSFEDKVAKQRGEMEDEDRQAMAIALLQLVRMLAPLAPHLADELWQVAGCEGFAGEAPWPEPAGQRKRELERA